MTRPYPVVVPETPPDEVERRFVSALVAVEMVRRRRRMTRILVPTLAAAAIFLAFKFGSFGGAAAPDRMASTSSSGASSSAPSVLATGSHTLGDGSRVQVKDASALAVGELGPTTHRLLRGSATFQVKPRKTGEFVVLADEVKVRVVGTLFDVNLVDHGEDVRVSVDVREGTVIVESEGATRRLTAGQRWEETAPALDDLSDSREGPQAFPKHDVSAPDSGNKSNTPSRTQAREQASSAQDTFAQAVAARGRGDRPAAIALFQKVLAEDPNGSFGQLAALELGRLALGAEGDPARASSYLEHALEGDDKSPLRAENLARLVEAYERQGATEKCKAARAQFAREFPKSPLAAQVTTRCR